MGKTSLGPWSGQASKPANNRLSEVGTKLPASQKQQTYQMEPTFSIAIHKHTEWPFLPEQLLDLSSLLHPFLLLLELWFFLWACGYPFKVNTAETTVIISSPRSSIQFILVIASTLITPVSHSSPQFSALSLTHNTPDIKIFNPCFKSCKSFSPIT